MAQDDVCKICGNLGQKKTKEEGEEKSGILDTMVTSFQGMLQSISGNITETLQKSLCGRSDVCNVPQKSLAPQEVEIEQKQPQQPGMAKVSDLDGNVIEIPTEKLSDYQQWVSEVMNKSKEANKKKEDAKKQALNGKIESAADLVRIESQIDKEIREFATKRSKELGLF